jgi:y4mF family transcriptional regulator
VLFVTEREHNQSPYLNMKPSLLANTSDLSSEQAARFGALVREHRKALGMNQHALALAAGVGRRFVIELEGGKPTIQLGRALMVANAVGLRIVDLLTHRAAGNALLPDMPDDVEDPTT